jgi:hypothetical protein
MKQKIAFALLMGIVTTCIISFTLVAINVGFTEQFTFIWLRSWGIAYLVVIPAILLIGPLVQRVVNRLFPEKKETPGTVRKEVEVLTEMIEE